VWDMLGQGFNRSAAYIRHRLTENTVRAGDKRVRYVTQAAYLAAGGSIARDLFEPDDGGWLTDVALLDRLVEDKLRSDTESIAAEGWKWVSSAIDMPWNMAQGMRRICGSEVPLSPEQAQRLADLEAQAEELARQWSDADDIPEDIDARIEAIETEIRALEDRPIVFDPEDMARAGAFVSIGPDGALRAERGFVQAEDEAESGSHPGGEGEAPEGASATMGSDTGKASNPAGSGGDDQAAGEDEGTLKPLSERLVSDLTAWRTLALQDRLANDPDTAFAAVLHAMVLRAFYSYSHESCLQLSVHPVQFSNPPKGLRDCRPARAMAERHAGWQARLPACDKELWGTLLALDPSDRLELFAHCAALSLNAQAEIVPRHDNGRISKHSVERRLTHAHVIARATGLDMIEAGWRATSDGYFSAVPKPRILADVTEARGEQFAQMIGHLKKPDMAREAERLLEDSSWLPEPLRTPGMEDEPSGDIAGPSAATPLPEGLAALAAEEPDSGCEAIAAE
ncbi:MAG: chromosome partitioning protein ParB, partial [Blastomonas sp.]|nr:chromosome partitioning protein ParB [Blastomonas sp.]